MRGVCENKREVLRLVEDCGDQCEFVGERFVGPDGAGGHEVLCGVGVAVVVEEVFRLRQLGVVQDRVGSSRDRFAREVREPNSDLEVAIKQLSTDKIHLGC